MSAECQVCKIMSRKQCQVCKMLRDSQPMFSIHPEILVMMQFKIQVQYHSICLSHLIISHHISISIARHFDSKLIHSLHIHSGSALFAHYKTFATWYLSAYIGVVDEDDDTSQSGIASSKNDSL